MTKQRKRRQKLLHKKHKLIIPVIKPNHKFFTKLARKEKLGDVNMSNTSTIYNMQQRYPLTLNVKAKICMEMKIQNQEVGRREERGKKKMVRKEEGGEKKMVRRKEGEEQKVVSREVRGEQKMVRREEGGEHKMVRRGKKRTHNGKERGKRKADNGRE